MELNHKNLRKTLRSFDKASVIEILCNRNVHSVCSLALFTQILKAELFIYQIEFKDMDKNVNFTCKVNQAEFFLSNEQESCLCMGKEVAGVASLFKVVKSMDYVKIETLWPVAVCFSHYRIFLDTSRYTKSEDNTENTKNEKSHVIKPIQEMCTHCKELKEEIETAIKMLNSKFEGVFTQKRNRLDFLCGSTLLSAIKNDLRTIHEKRLFYNKNGSTDRKIGEYLARYGISLSNANGTFDSLDQQTKRQCNSTFGEENKFVYKNGHDIELTALEHSFLILFYLYKEHEMYAFLCLEKRKLVSCEKLCKFYEKLVAVFKESTLNALRLGQLVVFRVKTDVFSVAQITAVAYVLHRFLRIHLAYRNEQDCKICLAFGENEFLYSEDMNLERLGMEKTLLTSCLAKLNGNAFTDALVKLAQQIDK